MANRKDGGGNSEGEGDPLDTLYAAGLTDFISTRSRLAAQLKASGDKEGAAFIKTAVKPSASAWAVNQAVRRSPEALERLLEASDNLAETQLKATGDKARERYQEAVAEHRQAIEALVDEAVAALADAGQKANPTLRERIAGNLRWAPQTQESRLLLRAGRLTRDIGAQDFGMLARMAGGKGEGEWGKVIPLGRPIAPAKPERAASKGKGVDKDVGKDRSAAAEKKEKEARQRRQEQIADLRAEARARDKETQQAEKDLARAVAQLERLQERMAELEKEFGEARRAVELAKQEQRRGHETLTRARAAAQKAADALAAAEEGGAS